MRLLRIAVKNLNSLYGEHEVDLEGGLGGAPLFLIMGPTGSGKSTLMDAVSLGLFGQTPRLQHAASTARPDEDARNVMSHGTAECRAQVDVQKVEHGREVRYRATWTCRRARLRADGNLQAPKRCLERSEDGGQTWTVLVDDEREKFFGPAFDQFLEGLTVTDFKRSMLLAQGEFSAFLKADEAERATILERLTDTSVYKTLGERAAARRRDAEDEKRKAEAALGSVQLLDPQQEEALRGELQRARESATAAKARLEAVGAALAWRRRLGEVDAALERLVAGERQVSETWQQQRGDFARLDEHERCAPASEALAALDVAREAHRKRAAALPGLKESEAALAAEAGEAQGQEQALATAQEDRARALGEAAPEIAQTRRVKADLQGARAEARRSEQALNDRRAAAEKARGALAASVAEAEQAQGALATAEQTLARCEQARPLVEALAGLEAQALALKQGAAAVQARRQRLGEEQTRLEAGAAEQTKLLAGVRMLEADAARLAREEAEGASALKGLLGDAADETSCREALSARQEALGQRLQKLNEAGRLTTEQRERAVTLEQLRASMKDAERRAKAAGDELAQLDARSETLAASVRDLVQQLDDQRTLQSYAKGRGALQPGKECPLCGGVDHPFVSDPRFAELDQRVTARCAQLEASIRRGEEEQQALQRERERVLASRASAVAERDAVALQGKAMRAAFDKGAVALEEALRGAACVADAIEATSAETSEAIAQCKASLVRLDAAVQALRRARDQGQKAQHELERSRAVVSEREVQLAELGERAATAGRELEAETARLTGAQQELARAFGRFGIAATSGVEPALQAAQGAVRAHRDADAAVGSAREKLNAAQWAASTAQAHRANTEAELVLAERELEARQRRCADLEAQLSGMLGGEDPDVVEQRLIAAREAAARALAEGSRRLNLVRRDLTAAETRRHECEQQLIELEKSRDEAQVRLDAVLRSLGLDDERALRASLLAADERTRIFNLRAELDRKLEQARTLLRAQQDAREEHLGKKPAPAEPLPEDPEALAALGAELERGHRAQAEAAAVAAEKLRNQEQLRERLGELQKTVDEKKAQLEVWERLHRLIGVNEGEVFKRFAQTLNLGELMGRANDHLERLAPRYRLVGAKTPKGESRIAFAVQDAFHAGEARPINTLSGGETFLVSLALALALSSYRSVKMPIETLLLDEGFGTLDPETLQVAMAALEALNASGTQVGIISHVEALKERVPARVIVSQLGSGRSQVRVELGFGSEGP